MPPAVEADPPPMNISMSVTSRLDPCRSSIGMVEKPPERVIVDRKSDWNTVCPASRCPKVLGLSNSSTMYSTAPATSRMTEVSSVSFTWMDQRRRRFARRFEAMREDHREPDRAEEDADHQRAEEPVVRRERRRALRRSGVKPVFVKAIAE